MIRAATGGKTTKIKVLPGFCLIEHGGNIGGAGDVATTVAVLPAKICSGGPDDDTQTNSSAVFKTVVRRTHSYGLSTVCTPS